jgi:hypothetical protein
MRLLASLRVHVVGRDFAVCLSKRPFAPGLISVHRSHSAEPRCAPRVLGRAIQVPRKLLRTLGISRPRHYSLNTIQVSRSRPCRSPEDLHLVLWQAPVDLRREAPWPERRAWIYDGVSARVTAVEASAAENRVAESRKISGMVCCSYNGEAQ